MRLFLEHNGRPFGDGFEFVPSSYKALDEDGNHPRLRGVIQ